MYLISRSYTNAASGFRPGVKVFILCYILLNSSTIHSHSYPSTLLTQPGIYGAANPAPWDRLPANREAINLNAIVQIPEMHYNQNQQYQSWRQFTPTHRQFSPTGPMDVQPRQHQHSQHQEQYDYDQHSMHGPASGIHVRQEHSERSSGHGHGHTPASRQDELEEQINQFLAVMGPGLFLLPGTLMLIPFAIPALPLVLLRSYLFPESEEEGKKPESEGQVGGHGGGHNGEPHAATLIKSISH